MAFVLVRQLFDLQIIQGENYINEFQTRTTKTRVLKSTRGNIYDKNNKLIASNVLSYSLTFEDNGTYDSTRQKNLTLNGVAYKVLKILAENGDQLSNSFHIKLDKDGNYAFDVEEGFTLSRFKADIYGHALIDDLTEDEAAATAEDMVAYLSGNKGFSIVLYGDDAYTDEELKKYGLTPSTYEQVLQEISNKMSGISDIDWKEIVDKYDIKCHYDSVRKASQTIFGNYFVREYLKAKNITEKSTTLDDAKEVLGEQYIVKQQIHNDRLKLNKLKRDLVPCITVADELKQYMKDNNFSMEIPTYMYSSVEEESDYTMICHITDWHIGYIINNCNGNNFNWEIANERINKYISECKKYIELYNIRQVLIISTGDMIENSYMRETQAHNCEFLQSMQIHKATKLIYRLLIALAEDCNVIFGGIAGNHDRMSGDKKKSYEGDNANVLITEHIKDLVDVSGCERISILNTNYNDSEINITVCGLSCKFIHGDRYKNGKHNLSKIISSDNKFYDLIFSGHLHNFSIESENHGRYAISTGCLSGYNDYSKNFYCSSVASQTIAILKDNEVEMIKDIQLS